MTPATPQTTIGYRAVMVGAAVLATAIVTAVATATVAGASTGEPAVTVGAPVEGDRAPAVVPWAVPVGTTAADGRARGDCPGSYVSTQQAGAAAPAVRPASPTGP